MTLCNVHPKKMKGFINKRRMIIEIEMEGEEEVVEMEENEEVADNPGPEGFISAFAIP